MVEGEVRFKGQDLRKYSEEQMRQLRGDRIAMIFQDPLMTLNPVLRIGEQMMEAILTHADVPRAQALERCREALEMVGIPSPEKRLKSYPHEFSGGMRQRVAIAIAMLNKPDLIICDEPTTALDVTIQGQILYRMQEICRQHNTALIWITHDLGVVAELADRVAVVCRPHRRAARSSRCWKRRAIHTRAACWTRCRAPRSPARACTRSTAWRPACPAVLGLCVPAALPQRGHALHRASPTVTTEGPRSFRCYVPIAREAEQA